MTGFHALLDSTAGPIVVPGAGSALEAKLAVAAGFGSLYISGYAVSGWQAAKPDIGMTGLREIIDVVVQIRAAGVTVPILVDADTGYGDVTNVADAVRRLELAGASGIQLEDQTWPKRCGHLAGKTVIETEVMERKLRAALAARSGPEFIVVARTDARGPLGLDEAIARVQRYAATGVDAIFVDAPQSSAELARIGAEVDAKLVINMSESGLTPILPVAEVAELGFDIVLYPTGALRSASAAILSYYQSVLKTGDSLSVGHPIMELDEFNDLLGMAAYRDFEDAIVAGRGAQASETSR